ncbi:hypothetical protein BJP34_33645 [Moorena producens PAL-8-15-08-1]|uniref:Uncharacterized protein n=1 Tax=Moorena producens PAL-8-15-08-1 TaxID=1458985 RepID=A0A1D8U1D3_9CYAN|nr:hypothetical protein BJP34_33645 [Moorena producens PAL-8-15-08-1]
MINIAYPFKAKGMLAKGNSKDGFKRCSAVLGVPPMSDCIKTESQPQRILYLITAKNVRIISTKLFGCSINDLSYYTMTWYYFKIWQQKLMVYDITNNQLGV